MLVDRPDRLLLEPRPPFGLCRASEGDHGPARVAGGDLPVGIPRSDGAFGCPFEAAPSGCHLPSPPGSVPPRPALDQARCMDAFGQKVPLTWEKKIGSVGGRSEPPLRRSALPGERGRRVGNWLRRRMGPESLRNGAIANWSSAGLRSRPCRSLSASRGPRTIGGPGSARSPGGSGGGGLGLIALEDVDEILVGADEEGLVARCEHSVAARGVLEQARPGGPSEGEHPDAGGQVGH